MKKARISSLLIAVLFVPMLAMGQVQQAEIVRMTYHSSFGGMFAGSNQIYLELERDGTIKMYNNMYYDSTSSTQLSDLLEGGSRTMSAKDFSKIVAADSLASYFLGKTTKAEYKHLAAMIGQIPRDTLLFNFNCCCDIPYRVLKVQFKDGGKQSYMECDSDVRGCYATLLDALDSIASKPGYTKPTAKIRFKEIQ